MTFINRIIEWNKARYLQRYDHELTMELITEEAAELYEAIDDVQIIDALADIMYVSAGALWKLGFDEDQIYRILLAVCDSNDTKVVEPTESHIKANLNKGPNYVSPIKKLTEIANERI